MVEEKSKITKIDREWLQLIMEAKNIGIEKQAVMDYIKEKARQQRIDPFVKK